ncbi:CD209 antigen-like protein C isoform X1 [Centroberyx affinis]|uniref:CD209 antigen-like protein C isoform X1 n=1 Tax=Centroberyx affinis TaxID=166261 RepID=UPI003A5C2916
MLDMTKKVRHKREREKAIEKTGEWEERTVDIYVSAASLGDHDPGLGTHQAVIQDTGGGQHGEKIKQWIKERKLPIASVNPEKSQCRALALLLGLLCLLLLAGFIGLAIHHMMVIKEKNNLLTGYNQLQASYNNLTKERNDTQKKPCGANCYTGEWNIGSSCYFISTEGKNWEESRQACADRQSHLMIINSKEEQDILDILNRRVWIGLTDREQEGTWKWVDGTSLTIEFWFPPQPNNRDRDQDCVEFYNEDLPRRGWNDNSCNSVNYWICERAIC